MAPESLCFHEGRLESSLGSWAGKRVIYSCCTGPPRAPAPVQAPAIRPSAVTTLASISLGGRGPVLGQRVSWKGRVLHCCPGAWLPSPGGGRTFGIIAGQFLAPQADTMGKIGAGGRHCF